ncbi:hypothetical protein MITS9509_03397 [Synechococcus sp. MIT S9509]|uniref:hypothetical protein n=1 Tax=unclassified Synechococcus TaxID=2626047 RepID=UPI0007BB74C2|nr:MULTISPECIES: hypothetical protein [unclassified Synechococcus]KZR82608.1 hypothetical protein MITS9504_03456 [Synechococcus sp. MIT S9504]KZR87557.1 hypothetical protein MITS9509_03397 [Synechococcus sp. MIT S9509]
MKTSDVISVAMSRLDGARAAAEMVADGRINPDIPHEVGAGDARDWGADDFCLEDASTAAFLGNGCEQFSRHRQMTGPGEWQEDHCEAFHQGFLGVALECLWAGGSK